MRGYIHVYDYFRACGLYHHKNVQHHAASCYHIDAYSDERDMRRSVYGNCICNGFGWYGNIHVFLGAFGWYWCKCNGIVCGHLHLHGFFSGWVHSNANLQHYPASGDHTYTNANQRDV